MSESLSVSFSKVTTNALDRLNDFGNDFHRNIQRQQQKKPLIGDLLNGQVPYAGMQTAAQRFDAN